MTHMTHTASSSGEKRIASSSSSSVFGPDLGAALAKRSKRSVRDVMMEGGTIWKFDFEMGEAEMCGNRSAVQITTPLFNILLLTLIETQKNTTSTLYNRHIHSPPP
jgi:hypothetical protein